MEIDDMDEQQQFSEWFERQRRESFDRLKDYGDFADHPHWGMGAYNDMRKAWMARATFSGSGDANA
jgi:hypothetical protein